MSHANSFTLTPGYTLEIGPPWVAPASIETRVDEIWSREKERLGDKLTNGPIYSLAEIRPDHLLIRPSEYKYVVARRRAPELIGAGLNIRPLAVTGILLCMDGLVLGRRGASVADDVGRWEPAPAGGLSRPNPEAQVMDELEEELGFPASRITSVSACGLVEDMESGVFDLVFRLQTAATGQDIQAAYEALGSDEYSELAIVAASELPIFLDAGRGQLLNALRPMLHVAGIL